LGRIGWWCRELRRENAVKLDSKNRCYQAMTWIEILAIVAVVILLAILFLPAIQASRQRSARLQCINNLIQIELAMKTWAVDNRNFSQTQISVTNGGTLELITNGLAYMQFQVTSNELTTPTILLCPADIARRAAASFKPGEFSNTNISYFLNVDTSEYPESVMIGDRNLMLDGIPVKPGLVTITTNVVGWTSELHNNLGNVGLADGGVQLVSGLQLRQVIQPIALMTNRLVAP
jgi:Tfp pilus assembly protein PilE